MSWISRSPAKEPTAVSPSLLVPPQVELAPAARRRVLLLDDQTDFREVIQDFLTLLSFEVTGVADGAQGLRAILRDTFDLIICDMMMAKVGGEMFYWAVTRVRPAARLRFVFITGHQNNPSITHFFNRINATVLLKPFRLQDLQTCMRDVERKLR